MKMHNNKLGTALVLLGLTGLAPQAANAVFTDVTVAAGVQFTQVPDPVTPLGDPRILLTSGSAWFDFDQDGDEDLLATQGDGCNKFFINNGDGTFTDVAQDPGMNVAICDDTSRGVAAGDYNNDGFPDIFITNRTQNRFFRNMGGTGFQERTISAGFFNGGVETNSGSLSWGDYNNDGYLDLYVAGYINVHNPPNEICQPNELWRNNVDGTFTNVADDLGVALSGDFSVPPIAACTLAVAMTDYDGDNDPDIMVVNDFGAFAVRNLLFRNDGPDGIGGWIFTDVSVSSGMDFAQFGMGIGIGDMDNDGDLDYYQTSIPDHPTFGAPNVLAQNNNDGTFTNISEPAGVDLVTLPDFAVVNWGNVFFDADHDGDLDLFVASGAAVTDSPMFPWLTEIPDQHSQQIYSFRNNGDLTFTENSLSAGLTDVQVSRGLTMVDYDNDGDQDLYIGNPDGTNVLYRNDVPQLAETNWLKVKAIGTIGNSDAIGSHIRVGAGGQNMLREIDGGSSFLSMNSKIKHFGLETATVADKVVVRFRSGLKYESRAVAANQQVTITEPTVTWATPLDSLVVDTGAPLLSGANLENHSGVAKTTDVWVDLVLSTGARQTVKGPIVVNLAPGEIINTNIPGFSSTIPREYSVVMVVGTFPGTVEHQHFVDVSVQDPAPLP